MTQRYLIFTTSFETRSAIHGTITTSLGRFSEVFTVEMARELAQHGQDKDAGFYGLIRKEFTPMDLEYAD